jgi:hypothetical protein
LFNELIPILFTQISFVLTTIRLFVVVLCWKNTNTKVIKFKRNQISLQENIHLANALLTNENEKLTFFANKQTHIHLFCIVCRKRWKPQRLFDLNSWLKNKYFKPINAKDGFAIFKHFEQ